MNQIKKDMNSVKRIPFPDAETPGAGEPVDQASARKLIAKTTLKSRYKLSDSWIERLGPPDKLVPNPYYKCAPEMQLYDEERVERFLADNQSEYDRWLEKRKPMAEWALKRQESITATDDAAETNARKRIEAWVPAVKVKMMPIPTNVWNLAESAYIEHYGERYQDTGENGLIAYVRHQHTNYEALLRRLERLGCDASGKILIRETFECHFLGRPIKVRTCKKYVERIRERVNAEIVSALVAQGLLQPGSAGQGPA